MGICDIYVNKLSFANLSLVSVIYRVPQKTKIKTKTNTHIHTRRVEGKVFFLSYNIVISTNFSKIASPKSKH